jgi:hypothetical protein
MSTAWQTRTTKGHTLQLVPHVLGQRLALLGRIHSEPKKVGGKNSLLGGTTEGIDKSGVAGRNEAERAFAKELVEKDGF